jgi:hypothetical protein
MDIGFHSLATAGASVRRRIDPTARVVRRYGALRTGLDGTFRLDLNRLTHQPEFTAIVRRAA